jgi:hypothetical protein
MLRIASDYDRLAESADDHSAHDSIMFRTRSKRDVVIEVRAAGERRATLAGRCAVEA